MGRTRELVDGTGRQVTYARLSLTDRCVMRCRYCMAEDTRFLPRPALLVAAEFEQLARHLVGRGVRRIRLTGGEPLARGDAPAIAARLGTLIGQGLDELTLTTNGTRLAALAPALAAAGIARVNVSLDSLDPERFRAITRRGDLARVLAGIAAAAAAGLAVKVNMVVQAGVNDDEVEPLMHWCAARGHALTLIETMPVGDVGEARGLRYRSLEAVRERLAERYELVPTVSATGGPARVFRVPALGLLLGFITPMSANFCGGCNRIRISADGRCHPCLGHEVAVDLRAALRSGEPAALDAALDAALGAKPAGHDFDLARAAVRRPMSATGG